jgi:hypothetical protein
VSTLDALNSLEVRWRELGVDTSCLAAGLEPDQVAAALDDIGASHPDLVSWFTWHNGCSEFYWFAVPTEQRPLTVDEATRIRGGYLAGNGPDGHHFEYLPTWVPILGGINSDTIVLDVSTGELLRVDSWDAEDPVRPTGLDLQGAVRYFFEILDAVPLDFTSGRAEINFQRLPTALQASPLL